MSIKVVLVGHKGRMGREITKILQEDSDLSLHVGIDQQNRDKVLELSEGADLVIDFSSPDALENTLEISQNRSIPLVLGTTGFSEIQLNLLEDVAKEVPIVYAANYSVGVNLLLKVLEFIAPILPAGFDVDILESHHRFKKDYPSGTAIEMARAVSDLSQELQPPRGNRKEAVYFSSLRRGGVMGEHQVILSSVSEEIFLGHRATSRSVFAQGAIAAAKWLTKQKAGKLYKMRDVLGICSES